MSVAAARPWLRHYGAGVPGSLRAEAPASPLAAFRTQVALRPDAPFVLYLDAPLSFADADRLSDGLAVALAERGVARGDRVAVHMQNVPLYPVALLAIWKAGAIAAAASPMLTAAELAFELADSEARVLLTLDELGEAASRAADAVGGAPLLISGTSLDLSGSELPVTLARERHARPAGAEALLALAERHAGPPPAADPDAAAAAVLTYTSGTTGPPKGAVNTHANIAFSACVYARWAALGAGDPILGIAPLFHVTGLVAHLAVAMLTGAPLVLAHRFDAAQTCRLVERHRTTFTVASITAFTALMRSRALAVHDLSSLAKAYSGGAPVSPASVERFAALTGCRIHNVYGLTETTSPALAVPLGSGAPVDPESGALAAGVPVPDTVVRVVDDGGAELPAGEVGELAIRGPQVVPGYWRQPQATAAALPEGELRTGDVGRMSSDGWFFVVDRRKDMIIASGFKVWPREVEDVLSAHPAVSEAAVVGIPDEYRGETVKAFAVLRPGAVATPAQLIAYARERLAAHKYPREIELVAELPKTATGKVLRRALRTRA